MGWHQNSVRFHNVLLSEGLGDNTTTGNSGVGGFVGGGVPGSCNQLWLCELTMEVVLTPWS